MQNAVSISLLCNLANSGLGPTIATSPQFTLNSVGQNTYVWAHGLGRTPRFVQAYMVCVTAYGGYNPGDQLDVSTILDPGSKWMALAKNATNVILNLAEDFVDNAGQFAFTQGGGGDLTSFQSSNKWALVFQAIL
jgi:hypothetical protein